jgi:hypothetical protein
VIGQVKWRLTGQILVREFFGYVGGANLTQLDDILEMENLFHSLF